MLSGDGRGVEQPDGCWRARLRWAALPSSRGGIDRLPVYISLVPGTWYMIGSEPEHPAGFQLFRHMQGVAWVVVADGGVILCGADRRQPF